MDSSTPRQSNSSWDLCKNDHSIFIPAKDFKIKHLPKTLQEDKIFKTIKLVIFLTVKITVQFVSTGRREGDPLFKYRGGKIIRTGTGTITVTPVSQTSSVAPRNNKKRRIPCGRGKIHITTANHVVFDDDEARDTVVELFYDDEENTNDVVRLQGVRLLEKNEDKDWCILECNVQDLHLQNSLKKKAEMFVKKKNFFEAMPGNLNVIVHHPHGAAKQISLTQRPELTVMFVQKCSTVLIVVRPLHRYHDEEMDTCIVRNVEGDNGQPQSEIAGIDVKVKYPDGTIQMCRISLLAHTMEYNKAWLLNDGGQSIVPENVCLVWKTPDGNIEKLDENKTFEEYIDLISSIGELEIMYKNDPLLQTTSNSTITTTEPESTVVQKLLQGGHIHIAHTA